jgi:uncharacterized protein
VIKNLAKLAYPNTQTILCPDVCQVGEHNNKKIGYAGYMKLGYLHPNVFKPDSEKLRKYKISSPFIIIRLARLSAHHDFGIKGMNKSLLDQLIQLLHTEYI